LTDCATCLDPSQRRFPPARQAQEETTEVAGDIILVTKDDPPLHALARAMRATFSYADHWPALSAIERTEYLGYALRQRGWLRSLGFVLTPSAIAARSMELSAQALLL
jgi:hypothetical protein